MVFWPPGKLPPPRLELASPIRKPGFTGQPFNSDGLQHSKPLTTSVSTSHGIQYIHLESKMAKVSHQFHRGVGHCRRKGLVQMAFRVEKEFFALHVVRNSRLLRRRGLVMERTLNDMRMYSKVILLPLQSPHVCVVLGGPHDFCWH